MAENEDKSLFQPDRRKGLRPEATDRRHALRPSGRLKLLGVIVAAVVLLLIFFAVYLINPKV